MPIYAMPAIDVPLANTWPPQQKDMYNCLPYYFAKTQADRRKTWTIWEKFFGKRKWQANSGNMMRLVMKVPSPHIRQFAMPNELDTNPTKDIMDVREITVDVKPRRQQFESPILDFLPNFQDFMTDHVEAHGKDIMEKMERFEDIFYRTMVFHQAPFCFVCAKDEIKVINGGHWSGVGTYDAAAHGKTADWLKANVIPVCTDTCTLFHLNQAIQIAENSIGMVPFSGSGLPKDSVGLSDKFCFVTSTEKYSQFVFDPWTQEGRSIDLNLVTNQFRGDFWGRVISRLEDKPLRFNSSAVFPVPEIRVDGADAYNRYQTIPNPTYADIIQPNGTEGTSIEVGYVIGGRGYDVLQVGPPPAAFASDNPPDNFAKMTWNGELQLTKKFLLPIFGADGSVVDYDMNSDCEKLKFKSKVAYGIVGNERRNIIPMFYLRKRGK